MRENRFEALDRIFSEARQLPAEARAEFVARSCASDDALRAEVLSLLEADEASGEFMRQPALDRLAQRVALEGWSLRSGETIGPYTIVTLLGVGGGGEVWRARDDRLRRDVAIKVLLPHFADDVERLRRFSEEARTAGALNHSNILTVYDIGEHHGVPYLVSECLEGQSLRQRLKAGPLSVRETRAIALGISQGLTAAHTRGIVHRDLKPENTFVKSDGGVKILDFGLAKLQQSLEEAGTQHTMTGVIVGTAGYMAPEQVKGENVDGRADLFALGVMMYEMISEQHPFRRDSTFETLHAVLTVDPPDVSSLNPQVPASLARIVMRLLQKTPDARFQSAVDLTWALEQATADAGVPRIDSEPSRENSRLARRTWVIALVLGALIVAATWALVSTRPRESTPIEVTRFTWPLPAGMTLGSTPEVSPDSRYVAFAGVTDKDRIRRLYLRDRGSPDAVMEIPGSEGAVQPFWSPDGESLGFFKAGRLFKVARQGGAPVPVASDVFFPFGGSWSRSGAIVFAPDVIMAGLRRIGADGKSVQEATILDPLLGDTSHRWPVVLPDGVHFLYSVRSAQDERRGIYVGRIDRPAAAADSMLLRTDSNPVFVALPGSAQGILLYVVDDRVEARRFDPRLIRIDGDARTLAGVSAAGAMLAYPAMLSASPDMLVFASSTVPYRNGLRLEAVDRSGKRVRSWETPEAQNWPRLSPNGQFLARQRVDPIRNTPDIWVEDLVRGSNIRVTTAVEPDIRPVWSLDGRYLAYVSGNLPGRSGKRVLTIAAADGTGVIRTFPCPGEYCEPTDWTPQGLLVNVIERQNADVWMVPVEPGVAATPLLTDAFAERDARVSHDGRWIAYVSEEAGRPEVSVRTLSGPPQRFPVSTDGGDHPVWRPDGRELFFVDPTGQLRSVSVEWSREPGALAKGGRPKFGLPTAINVPRIGPAHWGTPYDVSPDGNQIYLLRSNDDPAPREIHVIIGWRALL